MLEKFSSEGWRDFQQRYEGTFGFYRDEKGKHLVRLVAVGDTACSFVDAKGIDYILNADTERDIGFDFLPPKSQYFNTKKGAVYVQRIAARQFQRGISPKNIEIYRMADYGLAPEKVGFQVLETIFNSDVATKTALQALLDKKAPSAAISHNIALNSGCSESGTTASLFVLGNPVAMWKLEEGTVNVTMVDEEKLFAVEIADAFKRLGVPVNV